MLSVSVCGAPAIVTGPAVPNGALLELTRLSVSVPPLHVEGIDVSEMLVTALALEVHDMPIPLSKPHELTFAVALTILLEIGPVVFAAAAPGSARTVAVTAANAGPERIADYGPVMTTETPVTVDARMLLEVKSGDALPDESREAAGLSASEMLPAPVSVTLYDMLAQPTAVVTGVVVTL